MQPESLEEARDWLARAERDLLVADRALQPPMLLDAVAYHTQQATEKALKGFLAAHDVIFPRTHELESILGLCEHVDARFTRFRHAAWTLSPYVALFRYPGGPEEPPIAEAQQAIQLAHEVVEFVQQQLPLRGSS